MKYDYWRSNATQEQMLQVCKLILEAEEKLLDATLISRQGTMRAPLIDLLLKRSREVRMILSKIENDVYRNNLQITSVFSLETIEAELRRLKPD